MAETTTYVLTTDEGTDTVTITIDGDEAALKYFTDDVETGSDIRDADSDWMRWHVMNLLNDGYVQQ